MGCRLSVNVLQADDSRGATTAAATSTGSANATTLKAVVLIQNQFRRYRAKCDARKQMLVEYSAEQNQLLMQKLFAMALTRNTTSPGSRHLQFYQRCDNTTADVLQHAVSSDSVTETQWSLIDALDTSHSGFRLEYPLTAGLVRALIEFLRSKTNVAFYYWLNS